MEKEVFNTPTKLKEVLPSLQIANCFNVKQKAGDKNKNPREKALIVVIDETQITE